MTSLTIKGDIGSLVIHVMGYERASAENISDANWVLAEVAVNVGGLSGRFNLSLTTQDFSRFNRRLDEVLRTFKGIAVFDTDEALLSFTVEMKSRGTGQINGTAKDPTTGSELRFTFATDQSYLTNARDSLLAVIKTFPEIKEHELG